VKVKQVAEELGVRYVLEGSVRKSENHVRVTAQLIDALTGKHLWAERYDRDLKQLFAIQDEITLEIIRALQVNLTEGEQARVIGRSTKKPSSLLEGLRSQCTIARMDKQGSMKAKELAKEALPWIRIMPFPIRRFLLRTYWTCGLISANLPKNP